jgi:Zn-dependent protease
MHFFIQYLWENPKFFFSWMLFVVFSVSLHEYMHAYIAFREGDDTAARFGHLTLNPFKQMGIVSLIMLVLIGFCWGAVPVNPGNLRRKYSNLIVSLAGPLTNLGLFIIFSLITGLAYKFMPGIDENSKQQFFIAMFFQGAFMNMVLFLFNMLPVPGFDGYALVENFVPHEYKNSEFFKGTSIVVLMLALFFSDKLFDIGQAAAYFMVNLIVVL